MNGRSHPGDRLNMLEGNIHPGLSFLSLLLRLPPFSRPSPSSLLIPLRFSASPWANHPSNLCMSHQLCVWPVDDYRALFDPLSRVESRVSSTWRGKIPKPIQTDSSKPPFALIPQTSPRLQTLEQLNCLQPARCYQTSLWVCVASRYISSTFIHRTEILTIPDDPSHCRPWPLCQPGQ